MRTSRAALTVLFAIAAATFPDGAAGQDVSASVRRQFRGGHRFVHNPQIPSPFITTFIRNSIGVAQVFDLNVPIIEIGGEPILGVRGNVLFATMDFEYQHAIKSWLAAHARLRVVARLGSDIQSLLVAGVNATMGYQLGWLIKAVETERLMLSANVEVSNNTTTAIIISDFVQDIVDGVPPRLVQTTPAVRGNAGLRFAYGVSPLFGFTTFASGGYGESMDRRAASEVFFNGGGSMDFDLRPGTGVPLGLVVGFTFESFPESADDFAGTSSRGVARIEYTGRPDLGLGIGIAVERVATPSLGTLTTGGAAFDLRYFF